MNFFRVLRLNAQNHPSNSPLKIAIMANIRRKGNFQKILDLIVSVIEVETSWGPKIFVKSSTFRKNIFIFEKIYLHYY